MDNLHIYLRVSSDKQIDDGFGLDSQKELGLKISKNLNLNPIIFDEGSSSSFSDSLSNRPKMRELLIEVEEGKVQNLWIYQLDRLSRNDVISFQIRQTLKNSGVTLYVGDGRKFELENPNDKLMMNIFQSFSEFDNDIRTERLRRGRMIHIQNGGWRGGPTPFGYKNEDKKLVIDKYESSWVKKIYELYGSGKSLYFIRSHLMKNGVLSRRGNTIWNDQSIRNILTHTHYEGFYYYTDKLLDETVQCSSPSLRIGKRLIKKCRDRIDDSTYKSNYVKVETLLKEFLECSHCGSKFGQKINKKQYYNNYYCRGNTERIRNNGLGKIVCETKNPNKLGRVRSIDITDTDNLVWNTVIDVIEKSHTFKNQFKELTMKDVKSFGKSKYEKKSLDRRIKKIDKDIKMIIDNKMNIEVNKILGSDDVQTKQFIKKLDNKKLELESEKEQLVEEINYNEKNTIWYNWVNDFKDKIDDLKNSDLPITEKRNFLRGIINKIYVTTKNKDTHNIEIEFKSPFVDDIFEWNVKGKPKKGYRIIDGKDKLSIEMSSFNKRIKQKKTDQTLINTIN